MTIQPDTKDWTWVLRRPCPECGLAAATIDRADVASTVRSNAATWMQVLQREDVRKRPRPDVWSPLEYACHVRDVLRLYDDRLQLMLAQDDPLYPNWDLAGRFERLDREQCSRTGRRSDGGAFTVASFSQYFLHDIIHHLDDVGGSTS